jgi:hypothetical protein
MLKLFAAAVVLFFVVGSLYDFPRACYTVANFGACTRAQYHALTGYGRHGSSVLDSGNGAVVNWSDPRVTNN